MMNRRWLLDLANSLDQRNPAIKRKYHGFDISSAQFPKGFSLAGSTSEIRFSEQNILDRFPPEHRGCYDVVYIRALVVALRRDQVKTAVMNVVKLLSEYTVARVWLVWVCLVLRTKFSVRAWGLSSVD
jgi:hypothetical protein